MRTRPSLVGILIAAALTTASGFGASAPNDVDLDLDTAAGCFSVWRTADIQQSTSCTLEPMLAQTRKHEKWNPAFTFAFENNDSTKRVQIQFRRSEDNTTFMPELQIYQKGEKPKKTKLNATVKVEEKFVLRFDWTNNKLLVEFNQKELTTLDLGFQVAGLQISCSTAELKVEHLKFN